MDLKELKQVIESNKIPESLVILKVSDSDFIPNQYIDFILKSGIFKVQFQSNYAQLIPNTEDIFFTEPDKNIVNILRTDTFDCEDERIKKCINTIIICNKILKNSQHIFEDYIINIPKLESWQIQDYANTIADGIDKNDINKLIQLCNNDIYRLDQELQKIAIFPKEQRKYLFNNFVDDGVFNDLSTYNIFNFTNSIVKKDIKGLFEAYKEIQNIDVEPIGLLILLIQNFKDIINVQLSVNSSAESLNMKPNKYWAIRYSCGFYSKEELMIIYRFLTGLDKQIKLGEMPMEYLIDYIIVKVFTCA